MNRIIHFLQYHNAVPIAIGIIVIGAGGAYAAANPEAIYSAEETIVSIDNTYIATKDFSNWTPKAQIVSVNEDEEFYYVAYKFSTIDLVNAVWRDAVRDQTMKVSKADLGPYRDLGLYVTEQLKQMVDRELALLVETQEFERRAVSQKTVVTVYGGLVGQLLDANTEKLASYTPVVVAPSTSMTTSYSQPAAVGVAAGSSQASVVSGASAPIIQILGRNPAVVPTGASYVDLGAVVSDDIDRNIAMYVFVDGREVTSVSLDTSTTTEYRVVYRATDTDGHTTEVYRRVIIYDRTQTAPIVEQIPPTLIPEVQAIEEESSSPAELNNAVTPAPEQATTTPEIVEPLPEPETATTTEEMPEPESVEPVTEPAPEPTPEPTPEPVLESSTTTEPVATSTTP